MTDLDPQALRAAAERGGRIWIETQERWLDQACCNNPGPSGECCGQSIPEERIEASAALLMTNAEFLALLDRLAELEGGWRMGQQVAVRPTYVYAADWRDATLYLCGIAAEPATGEVLLSVCEHWPPRDLGDITTDFPEHALAPAPPLTPGAAMSGMVEKLSAVICCPHGCENRDKQYAVCQAHTFRETARAVLLVLRGPDEEMIEAAQAVLEEGYLGDGRYLNTSELLARAFSAAAGAALNSPSNGET